MITIIEYLPSHYVLFALLVFIALICVREVRKKDESVVSGVPWVGRRSRGIFLGKRASFSSLIRMQRWMADAYQIVKSSSDTYLFLSDNSHTDVVVLTVLQKGQDIPSSRFLRKAHLHRSTHPAQMAHRST